MRHADLQKHIYGQVLRALSGRPWTWLARKAGVPQSTLATQVSKCRFSVAVLWRISVALERPIEWFFPGASGMNHCACGLRTTIARIARIVEEATLREVGLAKGPARTIEFSKKRARYRKPFDRAESGAEDISARADEHLPD